MNTPAPLDAEQAEKRVLGWQTKLHRWAGEDEQKRFRDLFNLVCDHATLLVAWERVKRNRGSRTAGVDGITRELIERQGVQQFLDELRRSLRERTYAPLPVREHAIPKRGSGKVRKLGIPALADIAALLAEPTTEMAERARTTPEELSRSVDDVRFGLGSCSTVTSGHVRRPQHHPRRRM